MADVKDKCAFSDDDDEPIQLPDQDNSQLIKEYGLSLIGKVLNPKKQDVEKLIGFMPQHWGMENRISANDLGNGRFLFNFETEEDLKPVLDLGPFHYNFCMFVLVRWEPVVHDDYPWEISFWILLTGIPLHLWTELNLRSIGDKLGQVHNIEVEEGRIFITVDSRKPLKFTRKIRCPSGEEATIQIKYERLFKSCSHCGMMTHEVAGCPRKEAEANLLRQSSRTGIFSRIQSGPMPGLQPVTSREAREGHVAIPTRHSSKETDKAVDNHTAGRLEKRRDFSSLERDHRADVSRRSSHSSRDSREHNSYHKESQSRQEYAYRRKDQNEGRPSNAYRLQSREEV